MNTALVYLLSIPAWLILLATTGARLADMGRDEWKFTDHVRRAGLVGIAVVAAVMLALPQYASLVGLVMAWSLAVVWIVKKDELPWWDIILGVHRSPAEWSALGFRARVRLELKAIAASFKPRRYRKPMAGPVGKLP